MCFTPGIGHLCRATLLPWLSWRFTPQTVHASKNSLDGRRPIARGDVSVRNVSFSEPRIDVVVPEQDCQCNHGNHRLSCFKGRQSRNLGMSSSAFSDVTPGDQPGKENVENLSVRLPLQQSRLLARSYFQGREERNATEEFK